MKCDKPHIPKGMIMLLRYSMFAIIFAITGSHIYSADRCVVEKNIRKVIAPEIFYSQSVIYSQALDKLSLKVLSEKFPQDQLLQAILNNNLEAVKKVKVDDINKIIENKFYVVSQANECPLTMMSFNHRYLTLAIFKSEQCKTEKEKRTNFAIIETLLKRNANPDELFGYTSFSRKHGRTNWTRKPWSYQVAFAAVKVNSPKILELLFKHGARADSHAPEYCSLLDYVELFANREFVPLVKKYLKIQNRKKTA